MEKISWIIWVLVIILVSIFGGLWFISSLDLPIIIAKDGSSIRSLPEGTLSLIIAIGTSITLIAGITHLFIRLNDKDQGFSPASLRALGLILFILALLLISIQKNFSSEALATLLDIIAGYVLSNSKEMMIKAPNSQINNDKAVILFGI
jgi:hypothetical protein